jgi:hypothetical protein
MVISEKRKQKLYGAISYNVMDLMVKILMIVKGQKFRTTTGMKMEG